MENKKKWHLTIVNNETGEVLRDLDTGVIVGACDVDEDNTGVFSLICGSGAEVLATLMCAEETIENTYKKHPDVKVLKAIVETN